MACSSATDEGILTKTLVVDTTQDNLSKDTYLEFVNDIFSEKYPELPTLTLMKDKSSTMDEASAEQQVCGDMAIRFVVRKLEPYS